MSTVEKSVLYSVSRALHFISEVYSGVDRVCDIVWRICVVRLDGGSS